MGRGTVDNTVYRVKFEIKNVIRDWIEDLLKIALLSMRTKNTVGVPTSCRTIQHRGCAVCFSTWDS
jgi:hypothetical protein